MENLTNGSSCYGPHIGDEYLRKLRKWKNYKKERVDWENVTKRATKK